MQCKKSARWGWWGGVCVQAFLVFSVFMAQRGFKDSQSQKVAEDFICLLAREEGASEARMYLARGPPLISEAVEVSLSRGIA